MDFNINGKKTSVALPDNNPAMPRIETKTNPLAETILSLSPERVKALIESAKLKFSDQSAALDSAVKIAGDFVVDSQASLEIAISNASEIKKLTNALDEKRKSVIRGADAFVRGINGFIKMFKDKGAKAVNSYNRKASTYTAKIEAERRQREAKAKAEAEKLQKEIDEKAKKGGYEPPIVMAPIEEKRDTVIRTEGGASAHTRKNWTFEVEDISKVPSEYMEVDTVKVNGAIRAGIRNISGLRIFEKSSMVFR